MSNKTNAITLDRIEFDNKEINDEYDRVIKSVGFADPYISKVTIGLHEALHAHFLLCDYFYTVGDGIGGIGPKNVDLLHSALGRQFVEWGGRPKWNDRLHVCASHHKESSLLRCQ